MSRWLRNVNALLETLDNQVEETVEEHRYNRSVALAVDGAIAAEAGSSAGTSSSDYTSHTTAAREQREALDVEHILAKRGLLVDNDNDEDVISAGENDTNVEKLGENGDDFAAGNAAIGGDCSGNDDYLSRKVVENVPQNDHPSDQENQSDYFGKEEGAVDEVVFVSTDGSQLRTENGEVLNSPNHDGHNTNHGGKMAIERKQNSPTGQAENILSLSTIGPSESNVKHANELSTNTSEELHSTEDAGNDSAVLKPELVPPNLPTVSLSSPSPSNHTTPRDATRMDDIANNNTAAAQLKELRKLRRHILQLNSDLESAEREMEAQRQELDRAAARMERDRSRHKQEREASDTSHAADIATLTASHERALRQMKETNDNAIREMEARIFRAEQQRAKEGGERDADLADALERERNALSAAARAQEERNTMDERVTSLTTEINRLETRLEHATSAMDLASERERNAEEQLDKALSLHARQLGVRQRRETELEQTVADLAAALVVAKSKVEASMKTGVTVDEAGGEDRGSAAGNVSSDIETPSDLKAMLHDSQDEIELLRAQLGLERRRCSTLHTELQDLSKEQADELAIAHAKQRQYERKISDLTNIVAKLQPTLMRDADFNDEQSSPRTDSLQYSGDEKKETDHLRKQITSLSEKVFDQQTKIDLTKGEISTLKNRLRSATMRADTAERSLEAANQRLMVMDVSNSGISSADEELGHKNRRPKHVGVRRGFRSATKVESISSALGLQPGRFPTGGWQEMIASLLDTFDTLSVDLGSHFRQNPVSRLGFMIYLLILHSWAFFLLVYHAHAQGNGVDGDIHYGPEAMFRSYRHMEQVAKVASAANLTLEHTGNSTIP